MAEKKPVGKSKRELRADRGGPFEFSRGPSRLEPVLGGGSPEKEPPRRPPARAPARRGGGDRSWARRLVGILAVLAVWVFVGLGVLIAYFAYDLPDVSRIGEIQRNPAVTLVSADGQTFATFGDLYGEFIPVQQLPKVVPQALLATEDRRFYSHFGIDPVGLARASLANFQAGRVVQGGSSVTQQLAKNVFLTPDRTAKRKIQEVLLSFWLERTYTKDQILTIYLNRVYFGAGAYGIDAAAGRYFDKSARQLSLQEAAMLVGLLKAPTRLSPSRDLAAAQRRANVVIANMADAGFIPEAEAERAKAKPATLAKTRQPSRNARYFAEWVFDDVEDFAGRGWSDLIVITTIDMRLQAMAESSLEQILAAQGEKREVAQGAVVAMAPDGAVRAMVGGRDWRESSFNRATQAKRQPGSSFKYFVYLAGLEAGYQPEQRFTDAPFSVGNWQPRNLDGKYLGEMSLQEAFARSINTIAVQLSEAVGRQRVIDVARRLGVTSEMQPHPSLALGALEVTLLEMTGAFAATGNGGFGVLPHGIAEIRSREGQVLFRRQGSGPGRVLDAAVAAEMQHLMAGVVEGGTGRAARLDRPSAGKTGTSQEFRDAWFIGFAGDLIAGVWLGNDDNQPMNKVTGGTLPAQVWKSFMAQATAGKPSRPLMAQPAPPPAPSQQSIWSKILAEFGKQEPAARQAPAQVPAQRRYPTYDVGPDPTNQP